MKGASDQDCHYLWQHIWMTRLDYEYLKWIGVLEGFDTIESAHDHLQQLVCMDTVCNLAMHRIQQVHRHGAWDRRFESFFGK